MSNHHYDELEYREFLRKEYGCCECGYIRNGAHHPDIRCPKTGRCGSCGNKWPCQEHLNSVKSLHKRSKKCSTNHKK